jgi:hypothetical protein
MLSINSGGQTGADLAGLLAAERCGIKTGGWAPKGYRTEKGKQFILKTRFGLKEHGDWRYDPRTRLNVEESDVTVILSPISNSSGTKLTIGACNNTQPKKPYLLISDVSNAELCIEDIANFLEQHKPNIINVAGNRETVYPGLTRIGRDILTQAFEWYKTYLNKTKVA